MLNIKALLTKICTRLHYSEMFVVEEHTIGSTGTVATGGVKALSATFTKEGYYPLGVVGYENVYISGSNGLLNLWRLATTAVSEGSISLYVAVQNVGSVGAAGTLKVEILWVKI